MANRMVSDFILTEEGLQKLKDELLSLKTSRRREIAERIKEATEFGDLSENDEYRVAREEQAFVEGRISELESIVRHSRIVNRLGSSRSGRVTVGSKVTVDCDGQEIYEIVGLNESDPSSGKISADSPIGRALIGTKEGEIVKVPTPAGELAYKIVKIH